MDSLVLLAAFSHPGQSTAFTPAAQWRRSATKMHNQEQKGQHWNLCYIFPMSVRLKPENTQLPGLHLSWVPWRNFSNTGSVSSHWCFCPFLRKDTPGKGSACGLCVLCLYQVSGKKKKEQVFLWEQSSGITEKGYGSWPTIPLECLHIQRMFKLHCHAHRICNLERILPCHKSLPVLSTGHVLPQKYLPSTAL